MRALRWIVAIVAMSGAAWISDSLLVEAYGAGPPHRERTVNMDNWTSPWPVVAGSVLLVFAVCATAARLGRPKLG